MFLYLFLCSRNTERVNNSRRLHGKQDDAANSGVTNFEDHLLSLVMAKGK